MATSYINTGVIGQYLGGALSSSPVGGQFQTYAEGVRRKKRTLSGPTQEEREAIRQRREERSQQSILDTQLLQVTDGKEVVEREGVMVDTADVKVPDVPSRTPEEAAKVAAAPAPAPTITKAPTVAKPPPAPTQKAIAPEKQYGKADVGFVQAFERYYGELQSKGASDVRSGRAALQSLYGDVLKAAQASGRQEYVSIAQQAGYGVANASHISARNVGQAKAASLSARTAIRGLVDLDAILRENPLQAAPTAVSAPVQVTPPRRNVRSTGGNPFRRGR